MEGDRIWHASPRLESIAKVAREAYFRNDVDFLLACPPQIVDQCWAAIHDDAWDINAANMLHDRGRALWEAGDIQGALQLKRLFENAFRKRKDFEQDVKYSLAGRARTDFKRRAAERGMTSVEMNANLIAAVEECYFHDKEDSQSNFIGACNLLLLRSVYRDREPSGFLAAMCALREAYGFYIAGHREAARETWSFALPIVEAIEPDIDRQQAAAAAAACYALGIGAKMRGDLEMHEKLVRVAERLFERKGNDYAGCLYYLSDFAAKAGLLAEQLRLLKQILDVPDVNDTQLLKLAEMGVSICRAELEGRPELLVLGDPKVGIPSEMAVLSKEYATKMMAGVNPSPDEERRYAKALIEWIDYCERESDCAGAFWATLMLLRVALSHGPADFPVTCRQILDLCQRYALHGSAEDQIQYESLKPVAEAAINAEKAVSIDAPLSSLAQKLRALRGGT